MPTGRSLHVGLNAVDPAHYQGWSGPLTGCEPDAHDLAELARGAGYEATVLCTADATRSAVLAGIEEAAGVTEPGDIFLLTYSGHGGQVPDTGNDREADLQDETWCLFDAQVVDDELYERWAAFPAGSRVLVLSDSCHSGTVSKDAYDPWAAAGLGPSGVDDVHAGPVLRMMPDEVAFRTFRANRSFYGEVAAALGEPPEVRASVRLLSGCQDNQLSRDGTFNGLFTGTLLQVWADGRFTGDYDTFHREIVRRMPPLQSPNHTVVGAHDPDYDGQHPFTIHG